MIRAADRDGGDPGLTLLDEHRPEAIARRLGRPPAASYLRDAVYGAVDGTVTTFAVVAGAAGAGLSAAIVIVLGSANLLADGLSMAVGNFLGMRSEQQRRARLRREEERHIAVVPAGEREEVRQLLARDGLEGELLERATAAITADPQRWVDVMLAREHGIGTATPDPRRAAATTFGAFVAAGVLPLLAFVTDVLPFATVPSPFGWSVALTAVAFVVIGAAKGAVVGQSRLWSAMTILAVGGAAAGVAYLVGWLLAPII